MTLQDVRFVRSVGIAPFELKEPVVSFHPRVSDYKALMARVQALGTAATNWCTRYREEVLARKQERVGWMLIVGGLLVVAIWFAAAR